MKCSITGCKDFDTYLVIFNKDGHITQKRYCTKHGEVYIKLAQTNWNIKVKSVSAFTKYIKQLAKHIPPK